MRVRIRHLRVILSTMSMAATATPLAAQADSDVAPALAGPADALALTSAPQPAAAGPAAAPVALVAPVGPTLPAPIAIRTRSERRAEPARVAAPIPRPNQGSALALMGVGGAAVVIGLLIGGDGGSAVAIGGGVIGLVGLYRYLR